MANKLFSLNIFNLSIYIISLIEGRIEDDFESGNNKDRMKFENFNEYKHDENINFNKSKNEDVSGRADYGRGLTFGEHAMKQKTLSFTNQDSPLDLKKLKEMNIIDDERVSQEFIQIQFDVNNIIKKNDDEDLKIDIVNDNEEAGPDIHLIIEQEEVINEYEEIDYDERETEGKNKIFNNEYESKFDSHVVNNAEVSK